MVEIIGHDGLLTERLSHTSRTFRGRDRSRSRAALRNRFDPAQVTVHEADALEFDFAALPQRPARWEICLQRVDADPFRVAALPGIRDCTFMLQKEVVDRMGLHRHGRIRRLR